jgi:hypothetical protein
MIARRSAVSRRLAATCRRAGYLPLMSVAILAQPPLTTGRQADFEAFWYFTILGTGMAVLVGIVAVWAFRSIRPMWREGQRLLPFLVMGSTGFFCLFILGLVLTALVGLTNHATTPGTAPASIGR